MTDIGVFSLDSDGFVSFSLRNINRRVSGPEEALQLVAKQMLTEPGSNQYARQDGGGMKRLSEKALMSKESVKIDAALCVRRTMDTLRRIQRTDRPANATVVGLDLIDANVAPGGGRIVMRIRIRLQSGNSFAANFRGQST